MANNPDDRLKFSFRERLGRFIVPPYVHDPQQRNEKWQLPVEDDAPGDYIVEPNLTYVDGLARAGEAFLLRYEQVLGQEEAGRRPATLISKSYYKCRISAIELRSLVDVDESSTDPHRRVIYKVWPDFAAYALIDRSTTTVKADAAIRAFDATGAGIVWAVIDSGIDGRHTHFGPGANGEGTNKFCNTLFHPSVATLHRDFTGTPLPNATTDRNILIANTSSALIDDYGHGTHVAGIIAGGLDPNLNLGADYNVFERVYKVSSTGASHTMDVQQRPAPSRTLRGVGPDCKLISLKVLDKRGSGMTSNIMLALKYIREELNDDSKLLRVHGVNLSLGYDFDAEMFACGQSPLCVEVDRLVKSGVVVVVAAGNTGYAAIQTYERSTKVVVANTINDPGNANLAITVGSSHRDAPHMYGVSFFSSKGPTAA